MRLVTLQPPLSSGVTNPLWAHLRHRKLAAAGGDYGHGASIIKDGSRELQPSMSVFIRDRILPVTIEACKLLDTWALNL